MKKSAMQSAMVSVETPEYGQDMCSWGEAIRYHASRRPEAVALISASGETTWKELDRLATQLGHLYHCLGVSSGQMVAIALPNDLDCVIAVTGCWKVGATPLVLPASGTSVEGNAILKVAQPVLLVGGSQKLRNTPDARGITCVVRPLEESANCSETSLAEKVSPYCRATCSGGSTGTPKVIVDHSPAICDPDQGTYTVPAHSVTLVPGPLSHSGPFLNSFWTLLAGGKLVLMERFDGEALLRLVNTHQPAYMGLVPTMMLRIWRMPKRVCEAYDVSSLRRVVSSGSPCPSWLMRAWIEWLGPECMFEAYGASERVGGTLISGTEWLDHPGSVGKPTLGRQIRIVDSNGRQLPPGEVGYVYLNGGETGGDSFHYLGAAALEQYDDGWVTLGDLGYLDEEGYLYLSGRHADMIVTAGHNVYPAEVEAAIESWPYVMSCVVIGLPDFDRGQRLHAIVESSHPLDVAKLEKFLRERLSRYKIPKSFEHVSESLRNDAGKVRRSALRDARVDNIGSVTYHILKS